MEIRRYKDILEEVSGDLELLNFDIIIDGGEWNKIKPTPKFDRDRVDLRLNEPWTSIIIYKIWEACKLPSAFTFKKQKFYKRYGFPYFNFFGHCNDRNCFQQIKGECLEPGSEGVTIHITCSNTLGIPHNKKLALRGTVRQEAKRDLQAKKPIAYKQSKADKLFNNSGGECPLLQNSAVFATARQEGRDEMIGVNIYSGDAITSTMTMMKHITSIRELSTVPFYLYYWTDNQLLLWNEAAELGSFISIDASGSFVKAPTILNENRSSDVFLYNIVTHLEKKIYTLCQCLSSTHSTHAIFSWLYSWLQSGATIPKEVVVDCSSALLNAISLDSMAFIINCILKNALAL